MGNRELLKSGGMVYALESVRANMGIRVSQKHSRVGSSSAFRNAGFKLAQESVGASYIAVAILRSVGDSESDVVPSCG